MTPADRASASAATDDPLAKLGGSGVRLLGPGVPEEDVATPRKERPRDRSPVHAAADHGSRALGLDREGLGCQNGRGAGPERGDSTRVEERAQLPGRGIREENHAANGGEPTSRVAGKRGDPLEDGVPCAGGRHGPEISLGRLHVELRRHRPGAARVLEECLTHGLDGLAGVERRVDLVAGERGDCHRHRIMPGRR